MSTHRNDTSRNEPEASSDVRPADVLRRCGRTFWLASLVLPSSARHDLTTLYAFCRYVDDIADATACADEARRQLAAVSADLDRGASERPLVAAFLALSRCRSVPVSLAVQLIAGVRSDLGTVAVRTEAELIRYCYHVASTVGLMISHALNVPREGHRFAVDLGVAMQLTNIARDVAEDAERGRVYLPGEWIDPAVVRGVPRIDDGDLLATKALTQAVRRTLDLAARYYRSADAGMRFLPLAVRPGLLAASRNYEAIGDVIRRDLPATLHRRAYTGRWRKASGTARAAFTAMRLELSRVRAAPHDATLHAPIDRLLPVMTS